MPVPAKYQCVIDKLAKWTDVDFSNWSKPRIMRHLIAAGKAKAANQPYDFPGYIHFPIHEIDLMNEDHLPFKLDDEDAVQLLTQAINGQIKYREMVQDYLDNCVEFLDLFDRKYRSKQVHRPRPKPKPYRDSEIVWAFKDDDQPDAAAGGQEPPQALPGQQVAGLEQEVAQPEQQIAVPPAHHDDMDLELDLPAPARPSTTSSSHVTGPNAILLGQSTNVSSGIHVGPANSDQSQQTPMFAQPSSNIQSSAGQAIQDEDHPLPNIADESIPMEIDHGTARRSALNDGAINNSAVVNNAAQGVAAQDGATRNDGAVDNVALDRVNNANLDDAALDGAPLNADGGIEPNDAAEDKGAIDNGPDAAHGLSGMLDNGFGVESMHTLIAQAQNDFGHQLQIPARVEQLANIFNADNGDDADAPPTARVRVRVRRPRVRARHFVGRLNAAEVDDDDEVPMLSQNVKRQDHDEAYPDNAASPERQRNRNVVASTPRQPGANAQQQVAILMDIDEELPPIDGNNNAGQQSSVANAPLANGVLFVNDGIAPNVPNIIIDSASAPASGLASNVAVAPAVNDADELLELINFGLEDQAQAYATNAQAQPDAQLQGQVQDQDGEQEQGQQQAQGQHGVEPQNGPQASDGAQPQDGAASLPDVQPRRVRSTGLDAAIRRLGRNRHPSVRKRVGALRSPTLNAARIVVRRYREHTYKQVPSVTSRPNLTVYFNRIIQCVMKHDYCDIKMLRRGMDSIYKRFCAYLALGAMATTGYIHIDQDGPHGRIKGFQRVPPENSAMTH